MLRGFGVSCIELPDGLVVEGDPNKPLQGGVTLDAGGDHRIAMAAAVGALMADGPTVITGAAAVDVSFPSFFSTLNACRIG